MKKVLKTIILSVAAAALLFSVSCGNNEKKENDEKMRVFVLTGPTGIGFVNMWEESEQQEAGEYDFYAVESPDEIVAKLSNGEADIAAVSTNLAAKLYNKTNGEIKILAVNTLGVLNVLTKTEEEFKTFGDLKGRKIVTVGQGANPEYIIKYVMKENGLDPEKDVNIEFKAEGSELLGIWQKEPESIIIAPQPVATAILLKYEGAKISFNLTDEWEKVSEGSELMMGCLIARKTYLEKNDRKLKKFFEDYEKSVSKAKEDPKATGVLCEKYGIVSKAAIGEKAIPQCGLCLERGKETSEKLKGYLEVLMENDPSSIGGKMPGEDFWYIVK